MGFNLELLTYPVIVGQFFVEGLGRGVMYGLMGMGMSLIFGIMGLINFAHGAFFMIGTYAMYFVAVQLGLPFPVGIVAAAAALFVFGLFVEPTLISPLRRRLGANWLVDGYVMTIGLLIVLENLALIIMGPREHGLASLLPGRMMVAGVVVTYEKLMIFCVAILAVFGLAAFMRHTSIGRAIRATAENPDAALAMGIDTAARVHGDVRHQRCPHRRSRRPAAGDLSGIPDDRQRHTSEVVHRRYRRRARQRLGGDDSRPVARPHRGIRAGASPLLAGRTRSSPRW